MTRWLSLRRHLLVWLLSGVTAGWLVAMGFAYVEARHEIEDLLEERVVNEHEDKHLRKELAEHFIETLLTPLLFVLPVLGGWIWFATRRIQQSIENERRFTADAAHELRTPLAALATQAEVARRAQNAPEREHALDQLTVSARRAARLVDQLLTLARLEPESGPSLSPVNLAQRVIESCADCGPAALDKGIDLVLEVNRDVPVMGNDDLLRVLLRNLLDNAVRYTPAGGKVGVGVTANAVVITDTGPGIPAAERERVFDRFYRLAGQEEEGSGLGLSIVRRITELHGARLELADGPGNLGLMASITFKAAS